MAANEFTPVGHPGHPNHGMQHSWSIPPDTNADDNGVEIYEADYPSDGDDGDD